MSDPARRPAPGFGSFPSPMARGWSAEGRHHLCPSSALWFPGTPRTPAGFGGPRLSCEGASPLGAPPAAFSRLRVRSSGRGQGARPTIRAALAVLRPCRVQPSKAAGRSAGGRPTGAPGAGYEPAAGAAPWPAFLKRPAGTPLAQAGQDWVYMPIGRKSRAIWSRPRRF